jgi:hypothetical protein
MSIASSKASRIITRVKAAFVRLGIRSFNPKLKAAAARRGTLRTPDGEPIPPNTLAALKRDLERHRIVKQQIREIEQTRLERLDKAPAEGPHAMVRLLARVICSKTLLQTKSSVDCGRARFGVPCSSTSCSFRTRCGEKGSVHHSCDRLNWK